MLLGRRDERLDQEHVPFPAVPFQLHLDAVVGEPGDPGRQKWHTEVLADLRGQFGMGGSGENGDVTHGHMLEATRRGRQDASTDVSVIS
ncbi:hypothetical protein L3i22_090340 [Actinoplanes sp. L3-i22]|nr:hypothetical protein L3i22_090340 [Actinoplanes sp. L3-i22]